LNEEIRRDQLLGKLPAKLPQAASLPAAVEMFTEKQRLRDQYVQYIATLEAIKANPARLAPALDEASQRVDVLFNSASGEPAAMVAQASADRWVIELAERAKAESFEHESLAYRTAPNIYMLDRWLDVWDEVLPAATKYVFGVDRSKVDLRLDLRPDPEPMGDAFENDSHKQSGK
jgi:hypothetical protein